MKVKLSAILISVGILTWLCISYFVYASRYDSAARFNSWDCLKSYADEKDESEDDWGDKYGFRYRGADLDPGLIETKLTLIPLKKKKVFGYYGNQLRAGKLVSVDETNDLIQEAFKEFSKDSLVVVIKYTKEASEMTRVKVWDQMAINHIERYVAGKPNKDEKDFLKIDE